MCISPLRNVNAGWRNDLAYSSLKVLLSILIIGSSSILIFRLKHRSVEYVVSQVAVTGPSRQLVTTIYYTNKDHSLSSTSSITAQPELEKAEHSETINGADQLEAKASNAELNGLVGKIVPRSEWGDLGDGTMLSLVETYYWSMRDGNIGRWMGCMSSREFMIWNNISKESKRSMGEKLRKAVSNVKAFTIDSVAAFNNDEYIITLQHTLVTGKQVIERLAIIKSEGRWKIAGEAGFLGYRHHPGDVSKYDWLSHTDNNGYEYNGSSQ